MNSGDWRNNCLLFSALMSETIGTENISSFTLWFNKANLKPKQLTYKTGIVLPLLSQKI